MKKKLLIFILIIFLIILYKTDNKETNIIPDEAIRFRIIANSNTIYDQNIKIQIRNLVQNKLLELTNGVKDINETRNIINNNLDDIKTLVNNKLVELDYDKSFKLKYGLNHFPKKKYKGVKYKEGYYESLVITLGNGKGDNFWCVLFPPLCTLEVEDIKNSSDVEYRFFVKELVDKYLK